MLFQEREGGAKGRANALLRVKESASSLSQLLDVLQRQLGQIGHHYGAQALGECLAGYLALLLQPAHLAALLQAFRAALLNKLLSHCHGDLLGLISHGCEEIGQRIHGDVVVHLQHLFYQQLEVPQAGLSSRDQDTKLIKPLQQVFEQPWPPSVFEQQQRQPDHILSGEHHVWDTSNFVHQDSELR